MKILKTILIAVGILIAVPLIVSLFVKKDYEVEREITIDKPKEDVFDYVKFLKNQDNYSKWATMDPDMKKTYRGTDGTVGFISAWESNNKDVGKGEQEIKKITEPIINIRIIISCCDVKPHTCISSKSISSLINLIDCSP